jgi:hypothetical protein
MNLRCVRFVLALAAILILAALGWLVPLSRISEAAPAPSSDAAFKGKVLLVNTNNMMSTFLLEKAQVQKIGDQSFLVGKGTADGRVGGWYKGRTVRVRMEHIVSITEFDDLKEAKKAFESGGGPSIGIGVYPSPGAVAPSAGAVDVAVPAVPAAPAVPPPLPVPAAPGKQ